MFSNPGRLAWTVLTAAFLIFCVVTTTAFLGIRWFLIESTVPLTIVLSVGKDTVTIETSTNEGAERATRTLPRDVQIETDSSSQGYVTFTDPFSGQVVASITLLRDSALTIGNAQRPRFEFSTGMYTLNVSHLTGHIDVDIVPGLDRAVVLDVFSPDGFVRMSGPRQYTLPGQSGELSIFNRDGDAVIVTDASLTRAIPAGMQGVLSSSLQEIVLDTPMINILPDGTFNTFNPANNELSSAWGCYTMRNDSSAPEGTYRREIIDGRPAMHIIRTSGAERSAQNHAQTGCLQYLNTVDEPLPVTPFNYLEIRAKVQIRWQPNMLNACGQQGSECPIMIVMTYLDKYGNQHKWIHGFYSRYEQSVGWPLRCDSCAQDHERLNQDTWYTYTSGNLIQLLPEDQRPVAVYSVEFYASGHEYEVLLSEVSLMAGTVPQANPEGTQG
jgi:hypothetical protein